MALRSTFADTDILQYRIAPACALLSVTQNTLRGYADNSGIAVKRANDSNPASPPVRVFPPHALFEMARWRRSQNYIKAAAPGQPTIIAVSVVKGGTGKTTTSVELAIHLSLMGERVLLIDLDVQANATQMMGYESDLDISECKNYDLTEDAIVKHTFAHVVHTYLSSKRGSKADPAPIAVNAIKKPFGESGPHLIPSDIFIGDLEADLINVKGSSDLTFRELFAESCKGSVKGINASDYDVIIFDCPPNVSKTTTAALGAADIIVAPIQMDAFSVKGLAKLIDEITFINESYKQHPELVILPTHYAPQLARIGRMQAQLNLYRNAIAPDVISHTEEFPKSLSAYLPLSLQKPTSNASKEYRKFAELINEKVIALSAVRAREHQLNPLPGVNTEAAA